MRLPLLLGMLALALYSVAVRAQPADSVLRQVRVPAGFQIEIWAEVPGAREMAVAPDLDTVFVSDEEQTIFAVRGGKAGAKPSVTPVLKGLYAPSGVGYRDGWLYATERTRLLRYRAKDVLEGHDPRPEILADGFPDKAHHGTRILAIDPHGQVYVSVGTPCNLCQPKGIEGTILRFSREGRNREIFASGIRNSVGIAFAPATGTCYFTDNGVDLMGDDSPPDELNAAPKAGLFFGYPFYGGGHDRPPAWAGKQPPSPVTFPALDFPAHVAPLGLSFYGGTQFPQEYRGDLFVAQHGSWNRSAPIGYQVVRVHFADGKPVGATPFAFGWLTRDQDVLGRPADVKQAADGSLLVSDDHNGVVYKITYRR